MRSTHLSGVSSLLSRRGETGVGAEYDMSLLKGYQVTASSSVIAEIAASPEVDYVERDAVVKASALVSQTGATWGLGRISHRAKGSTTYIYDSSAGSGTTVYVVDTGIYLAHSQFGGRATWGANFVDSSVRVLSPFLRLLTDDFRTLMETDTVPIALEPSLVPHMV